MKFLDKLKNKLKDLEDKALLRELKVHKKNLIDFSSNDYLGLASKSIPELDPDWSGSTGSRLLSGTHPIHLDLEKAIAKWKNTEAAIFFASGYQANLGTISAIANPRDLILSDELNHASILDGIKLSGAKKFFYKHNDINHLEELLNKYSNDYEQIFVITDSIFSMDGDRAKLKEICALKSNFDFVIYVDEAHAAGLFGSGLASYYSLTSHIDIHMGTFSKAFGLEGAYIAGHKILIDYLVNKSRAFIYSSAPSPKIARAILNRLDLDQTLIKTLKFNIEYFASLLKAHSIEFKNDKTAIFIIPCKDSEQAIKSSQRLIDEGLLVLAIRPPTSPSPRLRICIHANHSKQDLEKLASNLLLVF